MTPVFIDLETRSAADLRAVGGYNYATHPTTRLLTVAWQHEGADHVWLPGLHSDPPVALTDLHLPDVRIHVGPLVPAALCRLAGHPWVGHNCFTFDRPVWRETTEGFDHVQWVDTYPLSLAAGLPGGLDKIGKLLWDEGKYEQGSQELKKAYKAAGPDDCEPENVPIGRLILVARYNVQDVRLLASLWGVLQKEAILPQMEQRVLAAHDAINDRGARIDRPLTVALLELAERSKDHAIEKINVLTGGALKDRADVQSRARVLRWLDAQGFDEFSDKIVGDRKVKGLGLRKQLVANFIDQSRSHSEKEAENATEDTADVGPADPFEPFDHRRIANLTRVVNVLELRMQALRITGGKLDSALWSLCDDHRARGLFAYWAAGPGRWAGRRIQVQNLQRPKEGIDTWRLLDLFQQTGRLDYDAVKGLLPLDARGADGRLLYPYLSVDDAASALIRGIFLGPLAMADYAAIEARMLCWMAGGRGLDIFWDGGDPYLLIAEKIFGPRDTWTKYPDPKKAGEYLPIKKHPYRQIGKVVYLGSGYQLGSAQFAIYAAQNGIDLSAVDTTPEKCILAYRMSNPHIAGEYHGVNDKGRHQFRGGLWHDLNQAVVTAIETGCKTQAGRCTFHMERGNMICTLPSQRRLVYRKAHIRDVQDRVPWDSKGRPVPAAAYWSPRYGMKYLYGGIIAQNVDEGLSRDALAEGMVRLEEHGGMPVVLHCHDEAVSETSPDLFPEFMRRVTACPEWLDGFPLDAEGGMTPRYSKTVPPGEKEQVWRNGAFLKSA